MFEDGELQRLNMDLQTATFARITGILAGVWRDPEVMRLSAGWRLDAAQVEEMVEKHLKWAHVLLTPHMLGTLKVLGRLDGDSGIRQRRRGTNTREFLSWFSMPEAAVLVAIRGQLQRYDPRNQAGFHDMDV